MIVVGAGPAGATTALLLARAGIDVLLLDRATFPRPKPCGDCLSLGAGALLRRLGLLDAVLAADHAALDGWRIVAPDGAAFRASFDAVSSDCNGAIAIERAVLDDIILNAALAAGARLQHATVTDLSRDANGTVTGVVTRGGVLRARWTVGADGLRSVVATRLDPRRTRSGLRKLSLTVHCDVRDVDGTGEMHVGDGICAGLARIGRAEQCNLTVVADSRRFGRDVARGPREFMTRAIGSLPRLRNRVDPDALANADILASGPFDRPRSRIVVHGAVLVGDAAGYYDPFTGQGVYQAIASAEILATQLIPAIRNGDHRARALTRYVRGRSALVGSARRVQRGIELVLSRPALASRAIRRIGRAPAFARALLDVTGDVASARVLLAPRALASLLFTDPSLEDAA